MSETWRARLRAGHGRRGGRPSKHALFFATVGLFLATALSAAAANRPVEVVLEPVRSMVVSAPVDGILKRVAVDEGDAIVVGQVLIEFNHAEEDLAVLRAQEVLRKRQFDYRGAEQLFSDDMTSETEKITKETELKAAEVDLAQAQERRDQRVIKAVQSGVVSERHHVDGEYVERGTPLLAVLDVAELDARFYVAPEQGLSLAPGSVVWVRVPLVDETVKCRIVFIDPQIDPSSGLMRGRARIDNQSGKLKPGLRGWISLTAEEPKQWP